MKAILIVDNNKEYRKRISEILRNNDYVVDECDNPIRGLELVALSSKGYDLVISALELEIMSGLMFLKSVKNISPYTACIVLAERLDDESELISIKSNIDLFLDKTKSTQVLLGYINKILSNTNDKIKKTVISSTSENIIVNTQDCTVSKNGKHVNLTPKEYAILLIFLTSKNKVITREDLVDQAWQEPVETVDLRLVDGHVKKLRDKLNSTSIMTVRGYGYRWNEA